MKIPYALTAAVPVPLRHQQMAHALTLGLPRLEPVPIVEGRALSIACYGPSLKETWQALQRPILSMSGATRWLAERGVVPDFHVDMDPRNYKKDNIDPPVPGVHYLMASVCCPDFFRILRDQRVTLWHTFSGRGPDGRDTYDWVAEHDPGAVVVHGGSTIGLTAIHLGGLLGYRHFEIHGMDGSFADGARHAGAHSGKTQDDGTTWRAGGVAYRTSKIMANAVAETLNTAKNFPIFTVFHGEGLTQALVREADLRNACCADQAEKAERVRRSVATFVPVPKADVRQGVRSFWDALLVQPEAPQWLGDVLRIAEAAEARRPLARYNTGTVPIETALLLRALSAFFRPRVAVEIGTFIGTSTEAILADHAYTCDRSNDCLPSSDRITCHPGWESSRMLDKLVDLGVSVDLFFLDGRLGPGDLGRVLKLSHPGTVYALDDVEGKEKGVVNLGMLLTALPGHAVVQPYQGFTRATTLALLVPTVPQSQAVAS